MVVKLDYGQGAGHRCHDVEYAEGPMALNWKREMVMVLSANEESLIKVARHVDWPDSWPDDDLREATIASLERFEQQEREGL